MNSLPLAPVLVTAPTALPVTLAEAKAQAVIDQNDVDTLLNRYIAAAVEKLDGRKGMLCGTCMITQTWKQMHSGFCGAQFLLDLAPVQSISSVKYYDSDNVLQTLDTSVYRLLQTDEGACVQLGVGQTWPSAYYRDDAVTIQFVAGYGDAASAVPQGLRHAILTLVAHWFETRETGSLPEDFDVLIDPYRLHWFP